LQELELKDSPYFKQADLMLKTLPHVAAETCFALKGGTAINLFVRDMQRLSVDIDLTYLPIDEPRDTALKKMSDALARIADAIVKLLLDNEGITDEIRKAFVVYLASHDRPMHELLDPTPKNIRKIYDNEFAGMTVDSVSYEDLIAARDTPHRDIEKRIDQWRKRIPRFAESREAEMEFNWDRGYRESPRGSVEGLSFIPSPSLLCS
jgi:hypothetical protein